MKSNSHSINLSDIILLKTLTLVIPLLASLTEAQVTSSQMSVALIGKWFLFSAVGLRLLQAGLRYVSWINVSLGILALLATFNTSLKLPVTIIACIYFLISTIRQSRKHPATLNEWIELLTDAVVFLALTACILIYTMQ
jgi:hypothetical protein